MKNATPIDWPHWSRLRFVKAWEACLLSLNIEPRSLTAPLLPDLSDSLRPSVPQRQPWFSKSSFGSSARLDAYEERLIVIFDAMEPPSCFTVTPTIETNRKMWSIDLPEFCLWALQTSLPIPKELGAIARQMTPAPNTGQALPPVLEQSLQASTVLTVTPIVNGWITAASEIARSVKREKPKFTHNQIAIEVHKRMTSRHGEGDPGMTGRGDKIPCANTIRRRALTGLKS